MYTSAIDLPSSCLVGLHSGETSIDPDFEKSAIALETLNRRGIAPIGGILLVVDPGDHIPTSKWRKKFAEIRNGSRPHRLAFISQSAIARGVITAIDWLQAPTSEQRVVAWSTVEEGIAWIERERRESLPILRTLYVDARRAARPGAGSEPKVRV
jgi:hypothetical protein